MDQNVVYVVRRIIGHVLRNVNIAIQQQHVQHQKHVKFVEKQQEQQWDIATEAGHMTAQAGHQAIIENVIIAVTSKLKVGIVV